MNPSRPPAFIHVDLDGLWTLAGVYGFPEGDAFERDPVFTLALPRLLDLFERHSVRATFFIVGRDTTLPEKRGAVAEIPRRGHELAVHSWSHRIDLEDAEAGEIESEIRRTTDALEEIGGTRPVGFRAPGYNAGPRVLAACARLGIRYDGSLLPTPWGPTLRFMVDGLRRRVRREQEQEQEQEKEPAGVIGVGRESGGARSGKFGSGQYGHATFSRRAMVPHKVRPAPDAPEILRIPLAVSPILRLPLHPSLGIHLGESRVLDGLAANARAGRPVTWLVHGLDALAPEEFADRLPRPLAESKGFRVPLARKTALLENGLRRLGECCEFALSSEYAESRFPNSSGNQS